VAIPDPYLYSSAINILSGKKGVIPEVKRRRNGCYFDVAPGRMNFSFRAAEQCLDAGITPYIGLNRRSWGITDDKNIRTDGGDVRFLSLGFQAGRTGGKSHHQRGRVLGIDANKGAWSPEKMPMFPS